jgi:hypothetical protein
MRHPAGRCGKEADTVTTPELAGLPSVPAPDGGPWRWGIRLAGIRLRMSLPALNPGNSMHPAAAPTVAVPQVVGEHWWHRV